MRFNRKNMTAGVVGLGLVGALVTGSVAAAQADTGEGPTAQPLSTTSSTVDDHQSDHDHETDHDQESGHMGGHMGGHESGHESGHMTGMAGFENAMGMGNGSGTAK